MLFYLRQSHRQFDHTSPPLWIPPLFFLNQVLLVWLFLSPICLLMNHDTLLLKLPFFLVMFSQIISAILLMKMLNRTASNLLSTGVLCCWSPPSGLGSPASFQPMKLSTSSAGLWGSYGRWSQRSYRSPGRRYPMLSPHPHGRKRRDDGPSLLLTVKMAQKVPFLSYAVFCTAELPFLRSLAWYFCGHPSRLLWWRFFKITLPITWRTQSLSNSLSSHCYMSGTGLVSRQATAKVCRYFLQEGQVMGGRQTTDDRADRQFT